MPEQWKPVVSYEGLYEVSDQGSVRSLDRIVKHGRNGQRLRAGAEKKQVSVKDGYLAVSLCKDGVEKQRKVHILVAEAFLDERPQWSTMVNHKNKVVTDNSVSNLEWSNNGHNKRHANAKYSYQGVLLSCSDLAEIAGTSVAVMFRRLNHYGWSVDKAVTTPLRGSNA